MPRSSATSHELARIELLAGVPGQTLAAAREAARARGGRARHDDRPGGRPRRALLLPLRRDALGEPARPRQPGRPAARRLLRRGGARDGHAAHGDGHRDHARRRRELRPRDVRRVPAAALRGSMLRRPLRSLRFRSQRRRPRRLAAEAGSSRAARVARRRRAARASASTASENGGQASFAQSPNSPVGEDGAGEPRLGVDPEERAGGAEVAERPRRDAGARPVRLLAVAQLEGETPVVRLHPAPARQHADEARELDAARLGERLRRDDRRARAARRPSASRSSSVPR